MNVWLSSAAKHQWNPEPEGARDTVGAGDRPAHAHSRRRRSTTGRRKPLFDRVQQHRRGRRRRSFTWSTATRWSAISPALRNVEPSVLPPANPVERGPSMDRDREVEPLLDVGISVDYPNRPAVLRDVRFTLARGEIAGLIGASGSGKSTLALAVMRLLELRGGVVRGSHPVRRPRADEPLRRRTAPHPRQGDRPRAAKSPIAALNPALRIETQLREVWRAHASDALARRPRLPSLALLARMGLPADAEFLRRYPRQLSVGQAQRVAIAMAVMHRPKLLIADEPTSALDPSSRGGILDLFEQPQPRTPRLDPLRLARPRLRRAPLPPVVH